MMSDDTQGFRIGVEIEEVQCRLYMNCKCSSKSLAQSEERLRQTSDA